MSELNFFFILFDLIWGFWDSNLFRTLVGKIFEIDNKYNAIIISTTYFSNVTYVAKLRQYDR